MKSTVETKIIELVKLGHELAKELHCAESAALVSDLASQLEVQLARSNALAAENAGLIRSSEILLHEASEVYRAYNKTQLPDGNLVDEQSLQEVYDAINATPATDAFLAEVRAQGVEEFVMDFTEPAVMNNGTFYNEDLVEASNEFAAQLRQEAAQ